MKNKVLVICAGCVLFIYLVFSTYAWYSYFLRASGEGSLNVFYSKSAYSGIIFQDNGNNVYDTKAESLEDNNIGSVPSYNFQITNTGNNEGKYTLYLEDLPVSAIDDGCTENTLLARNQLKYQLLLNDKVIKEGFMETINDNILDSRSIGGKETNNYSLKIYIHDEATDWFGKHYHYKVTMRKDI